MAMLVELGATQWTKINVGSIVAFLHVKAKSHAILPGDQALDQPAKDMQKIDIVLMGRTDLAGRRVMGHSKIGLTVKEEQHLSALNVAVKSHAILPGDQALDQPAKNMQKIDIVLMGRTDLAGRSVMGHSKI